MSDSKQPTYLVCAYTDPVIVRINGKANYLNCNNFREFIEKVVAQGTNKIVLDFDECKGMDSTFLGILAGTALQLRKSAPPGDLILKKLGKRNHELIRNLGLHNLLTISEEESAVDCDEFKTLKNEKVSSAEEMLRAHESLTEADSDNVQKFQDVIAFLRNQVESDEAK